MRIQSIIWIAFFTSLTCVGGFLRIPILPVPFTLQTLFVYLSGSLLGSKKGGISQLLFLLIGLAGVPVFAMGGGPGYILQPTFGYLAAFPIGAFVLGIWIERAGLSGRLLKWYVAHILAFLVIFLVGVLYLFINMNYMVGKEMSLFYAVLSGMVIFIPGEMFKIILSVGITVKFKQFFNH
jgi:biotin transport system substrate-specific component